MVPTCGDIDPLNASMHTMRINPSVLSTSTYLVALLLRHELGHSVGLANAEAGCQPQSSIMQGVFASSCLLNTSSVKSDDVEKVLQWCQNPASCDKNLGGGAIGIPVGYCPIQNPVSCNVLAWMDGYLAGEDLDYCKWQFGCGPGFSIVSTSGGNCCVTGTSPIVIDVDGDGFDLTNAEDGVLFDLDADGTADMLSWTAVESDDAWLFLDRNDNDTVDDGTELFGNFTPQPPSESPNGFIALAVYDEAANGGNNDGKIGPEDSIYDELLLWQDIDHDGNSTGANSFRSPTAT